MAFDAGAAIIKIKGDITDFEKSVDDAKALGSRIGEAMAPIGTVLTAIGAAGALGIKAMVDEAMNAQTEMARLTQLVKQTTGATDEQIQALSDQADALQKVGVTSAGALRMGQSQLATFALSTDAISTLTPAMADLAAATAGYNANGDQLINLGNLIGKVMSGQVGALTKYGVTFSEAQQKILETGDEMERASTLTEILGQNFGGLNEALAETSQGSLTQLQFQFEDMLETLGNLFLPIIEQVVTQITPVIEKITEWVVANPQLASTLAMVALAVTAIAAVLGPILLILPGLITLWTALTGVVGVIGGAFAALSGPILLIVAAIAAVIAAGYLLITHWDEIKAFAASVWQAIVEGITAFVEMVVEIFTTYIQIWTDIISFALAFILGLFGTNVEEIKSVVTAFWEALKIIWNGALELLKGAWSLFWKFLVDVYGPIIEGISAVLGFFWDNAQKLFTAGGEAISNAWSGVWDGIKNVAQSVGNTVVEIVKGIINSIIDKINWFIRKVNEIAQKGAVGGLKVPTLPEIPMLAKGGIVTGPTLAMIGEQGPEAVVPLTGENAPAVSGGLTVIINDPVVRDESDFDRLGQLFRDVVGRDIEMSRLGMTR